MSDLRYDIRYKKSVDKELRKLSESQRQAVVQKILSLASHPRPSGSVKLRGSKDLYRVRYADYRIIYSVSDAKLTILVIKVGHRKEVYQDF